MTAGSGGPANLAAIAARAAAATEGPWEWSTSEATMNDCSAYRFGPRAVPPVFLAHQMRHADAEFIAHAREDVPALVAEVRAARAAVERAEARLSLDRVYDALYEAQWGDLFVGPDEREATAQLAEAVVAALRALDPGAEPGEQR